MPLIIEIREGSTIIRVDGRIDAGTVEAFASEFPAACATGGATVAVDMRGCPFINSAGLRVFIIELKRMQAAGRSLVLFGLDAHLSGVFRIAGFHTIFRIVETEDDAVGPLLD